MGSKAFYIPLLILDFRLELIYIKAFRSQTVVVNLVSKVIVVIPAPPLLKPKPTFQLFNLKLNEKSLYAFWYCVHVSHTVLTGWLVEYIAKYRQPVWHN